MAKMICIFCDAEIKKEDKRVCPECGIEFLPQLLPNEEYELSKVNFKDKFASIKRDGVYVILSRKGLLNRSLKKIANPYLQDYFEFMYANMPPNILLIGEMYAHGILIGDIAGICNSSLGKEIPENMKLYVFGMFNSEKPNATFRERYEMIKDFKIKYIPPTNKIEIVEQLEVYDLNIVETLYKQFLSDGFEGLVLMDGNSIHKHGRITINSGQGYKLKPFKTDDLEIVGVNERMLNLNESKTDERGYATKSNNVNMKQPTGIAGTFDCKMESGLITKVTITGNEDFRRKIWENKEDYIGRIAVVKSFDYGTKIRLRHPNLLRVQEKVEK